LLSLRVPVYLSPVSSLNLPLLDTQVFALRLSLCSVLSELSRASLGRAQGLYYHPG